MPYLVLCKISLQEGPQDIIMLELIYQLDLGLCHTHTMLDVFVCHKCYILYDFEA